MAGEHRQAIKVSRGLAALVLALAAVPGLARAATSEDLERLFAQLRDAPDMVSAQVIEQRIWQAWLHSGDAEADALMQRGIAAMERGEFADAVEEFTRLIERRPDYAEGWNKRATVYYLMQEMELSVADIERTLALEPRHFGALSGMGLIFLSRDDLHGALDAFRQVLKIHPQSPSARIHVERIEALLKGRAV